jgi:hypothetical protein
MLGGGVFITQNKVLPGSYINFVNASVAGSTVGDRGTVAIALPLGKSVGEVIKITAEEFAKDCENILGKKRDSAEMIALREIFCHANKVYIYDLGAEGGKTVTDAVAALEACDFNVLCAYTDESADVTAYITAVKTWRDEMGKKCQVVVYNQIKPDHEGVINVVSTVSDDGAPAYAMVAWTAGAEAGCKINESCTNMLYDGEYTVVANKTQAQLEECLTNGQFVFHLVYDEIRVLEDINSLTTTTVDKGDDFKANQTIRVVDQIANDIAKLFNTKYLGKIANNETGRISLWGEIVKHHRELEAVGAIENFNSSLLKVTQGNSKKSVVVTDVVTVTNAMAQLYMTVVIQ